MHVLLQCCVLNQKANGMFSMRSLFCRFISTYHTEHLLGEKLIWNYIYISIFQNQWDIYMRTEIWIIQYYDLALIFLFPLYSRKSVKQKRPTNETNETNWYWLSKQTLWWPELWNLCLELKCFSYTTVWCVHSKTK